jgi:predicted component of viral defense system (DUF524 family)
MTKPVITRIKEGDLKVTAKQLSKYAKHPTFQVRLAVAKHPNTDDFNLIDLANLDKSKKVKAAALSHLNTRHRVPTVEERIMSHVEKDMLNSYGATPIFIGLSQQIENETQDTVERYYDKSEDTSEVIDNAYEMIEDLKEEDFWDSSVKSDFSITAHIFKLVLFIIAITIVAFMPLNFWE